MTIFGFSLFIHIISGSICLIVGLAAGFSAKKRGKHTVLGELYHGSYIVVFISSLIMAVINWHDNAYLFFIALFSYGLALFGYLARKKRPRGWLAMHIGGMLGSYIGIVTAVLVVNAHNIPVVNQLPALILWFLPTIIGTPIIIGITNRFKNRASTTDHILDKK